MSSSEKNKEAGGARAGDIQEEGPDVRAVGSGGRVGAECGAVGGKELNNKLGQGGREGGGEHEQQIGDSSLDETVSDNLDVTITFDFDDWSDDESEFKTRLLATPHLRGDVTRRGSGGSSRTLIAESGSPEPDDDEVGT